MYHQKKYGHVPTSWTTIWPYALQPFFEPFKMHILFTYYIIPLKSKSPPKIMHMHTYTCTEYSLVKLLINIHNRKKWKSLIVVFMVIN